ncbi:hypothetical protein BDZ91DRAFT_400549 [Kalaharituber pfeilii]|nr:hypothetical protein BDZ91DRAFT_400549 [Kalaharituber pfeilii]
MSTGSICRGTGTTTRPPVQHPGDRASRGQKPDRLAVKNAFSQLRWLLQTHRKNPTIHTYKLTEKIKMYESTDSMPHENSTAYSATGLENAPAFLPSAFFTFRARQYPLVNSVKGPKQNRILKSQSQLYILPALPS